MPAFYSRTLHDYDNEPTTFRVRIPEINAGNIADIVTKTANLGTAVNGITLGALENLRYGNETIAASGAAASAYAQRELKWLVRYRDTVLGDSYRVTIGTADPTHLDPNARGQAQIGDAGDVDAFVTAFEDLVVSDAGNAVEVTSITLVGRNI